MKIQELKKLSNKELNEKLAEFRDKTRELRFSVANNQLKAVRELRVVKKTIANILTLLNQNRIEKENTIADEKQATETKSEVAETKSSK